MSSRIPFLKLIAGALFLLAGLFIYLGVSIPFSIPILLIIAGLTLIAVVLIGYKPTGGDVALFLAALLVLGVVTTGAQPWEPTSVTYSAQKDEVDAKRISATVSANFGSIDIAFSSDRNLAYRVEFSRPFFSPTYLRGEPDHSVSKEVRDGTLFLNASASTASIRVVLGPGYTGSIDASTITGSIAITAPRSEAVEKIVLSTNTGSIDAEISSENVKDLKLKTNTGSVDFESDYLAPAASKIPVTISTNTGSVEFNVKTPRSVAATITASANIGSVHHSLEDYTITQSTLNRLEAKTGDPSAEKSFEIVITTGTGSIELNIKQIR